MPGFEAAEAAVAASKATAAAPRISFCIELFRRDTKVPVVVRVDEDDGWRPAVLP